MKSAIKLYKEDLSDFYNFLLEESDVEVNTEIVDWRVMMWRKIIGAGASVFYTRKE